MLQLLVAIDYLHDNQLMHRDIKGANILLNSDGVLKLADFGLSKKLERHRPWYTNKVVTLWYRAPELLLGAQKYSKNIDIWSAGWFFAELFIGKPLLPGTIEANQIDLIFKLCGTPTYADWPEVVRYRLYEELVKDLYPSTFYSYFQNLDCYGDTMDDELIDLLSKMLTLWPEQRYSAKQCLEHPYFTSKPLPCEKSKLPKVEGEAHEHAMREELKEQQKAEMSKKMDQKWQNYYQSGSDKDKNRDKYSHSYSSYRGNKGYRYKDNRHHESNQAYKKW